MDLFNQLPAEIIIIIAGYLSDSDLINITNTIRYVGQILDSHCYFWKERFMSSTHDKEIINRVILYDVIPENFNDICYRWGARNQISMFMTLVSINRLETAKYHFYKGFLDNTVDIQMVRDFGIIAGNWHSKISSQGLNLLCTTTAPSKNLICFLDELVSCVGNDDLRNISSSKLDNHHVRYIKQYFFDK